MGEVSDICQEKERETKRGRKEDRENERERAIKSEKGGREAVVKN